MMTLCIPEKKNLKGLCCESLSRVHQLVLTLLQHRSVDKFLMLNPFTDVAFRVEPKQCCSRDNPEGCLKVTP